MLLKMFCAIQRSQVNVLMGVSGFFSHSFVLHNRTFWGDFVLPQAIAWKTNNLSLETLTLCQACGDRILGPSINDISPTPPAVLLFRIITPSPPCFSVRSMNPLADVLDLHLELIWPQRHFDIFVRLFSCSSANFNLAVICQTDKARSFFPLDAVCCIKVM